MTDQEKLRNSLKFWLMRKLWVKAGALSRWAGNRIVAWTRAADKRDYPQRPHSLR